ncbi:MAG: helix-turn-helix transcriptional regulator [Firmicutes bacterium]|nr:helix-turn-helix transcriptional regulator [Bacillota bacterium]
MDRELFCSVLKNLLHVNVCDADRSFLQMTEEKYCYHQALQPMFQADVMQSLVQGIKPGILYEFRDRLGICLLLFLLDGTPMIIGPFVRREFDVEHIRRLMLSAGLPGSHEESIRLYYSTFPLCSVTRAIEAILACSQAFLPDMGALDLARIDDYPDTHRLPAQDYQESLDYSSVYMRYELENQFLRTIEKGDVEHVLITHDQMAAAGVRDKRYTSAIYQDINVSAAILRTMARKAAENGGASVVEINEITQRAVQKMLSETTAMRKMQVIRNMCVELAEAVDRARSRLGNYSAPIRKAADTLRHNYSQDMSLPQLAEHVGMSPSHLSRTFSKEVGMSISQYVTTLRCEEAASLLKSSDMPVQEISAYVGYLDNNYFVKVFRKLYGMTPTQYRTGTGETKT